MGGVMAGDYFFQFLASSSGGIDMNVSASSAPMTFSVAPDTSKSGVDIERVNISVVADSAMSPEFFGGGTSELAAGIKVQVLDAASSQVHDFLDGETITMNHDWAYLAGADVVVTPGTSAGATAHQPIRWTLGKAGEPLHLPQGHRLAITVQDDISSSGAPGIIEMRAMAQGVDH